MLKFWDSVPAFVTEVKEASEHFSRNLFGREMWTDTTRSWNNGRNGPVALKYALHGDSELAQQTESLISKIDVPTIETTGGHWTPNAQGAFPCVPDYLSGSPTSMRSWRKTRGDRYPIRIFVCPSAQAHVTAEQMKKRGAAILALVQILQSIRPLEIFIVWPVDNPDKGEEHVFIVKLDTLPLDMAIGAYCLADVSLARTLMFSYASYFCGYRGSFPSRYISLQESNYPVEQDSPYTVWFRKFVGMQPEDIYLKFAHPNQLVITDPVAWVNQNLDQYID